MTAIIAGAGNCLVCMLKTGLPEDKRGGVVVQGHMFFSAIGRLQIFFYLGSATTGEQTRERKMDKPIQETQKIQYDVKQADTDRHLNKGRLG